MSPRKVLTLLFLAALLGIGYHSMNAAPVLSDQSYSYHGGTQWHTNFSDAREVAAEQNKPILVYFWTTWCTYCEDYNQKVYSDPTVRDKLDEFVLVAVNLDNSSPEATRLKQQYNANYPPQHVAVTPQGERLVKINGYAKKEAFIKYLERAQRRAKQ
ncbi:thioredoxin family protein [Haladaptatus sp. NG-SE-30]